MAAIFRNNRHERRRRPRGVILQLESFEQRVVMSTLGTPGPQAAAIPATVAPQQDVRITGTIHQQDRGDVPLQDGQWAGTTTQPLRIQGFELHLPATAQGLGVEYMVHQQDIGDTPWVPGGQWVGAKDRPLRVQGFAIRLTGPEAAKYDVVYSGYLQNIGTTAEFKNGEFCGTRDLPLRVQAMTVTVVPKAVIVIPQQDVRITGTIHQQDLGDVPLRDGRWAGKTNRPLRIQGFELHLPATAQGLGVEYMVHQQDIGDTPWVPGGQWVGAKDRPLRVQGFAIRLTGPEAAKYDVVYSGYLQDQATTKVFKNGEFCGTRTQPLRVQAMTVTVVPKGVIPNLPAPVAPKDLRGVWAGPLEGVLRDSTPRYVKVTTSLGTAEYKRESEKTARFEYDPQDDRVDFEATVTWKWRTLGQTVSTVRATAKGWVNLRNPSIGTFHFGEGYVLGINTKVEDALLAFFEKNSDAIRRS